MSRTEHRVGKLRKLGNTGISLEDTSKALYEQIEEEPLPSYYENYTEWMKDQERYVVVGDSLYKVLEDSEIDENDDIAKAFLLDDGAIQYEVRFYNGGACFSEMIEEAVCKMKNGTT